MKTVYNLLNNDAKRWWYHQDLRKAGNVKQARQLERKSILSKVETLKTAVFAHVGRGGWSIHFVSKYGGINHMAKLEGYGGIDEPMIQACIMLGIPVCDTTVVSDDDIYQIIGFPIPSHPDATNLGSPDNSGRYSSMSYAPFMVYFQLCEKIGAKLYNA